MVLQRTLTLSDVKALMAKRRPWTFRMAMSVMDPSTHLPVTQFWLATGRAEDEPLEVHKGTLNRGTPIIVVRTWAEVEAEALTNIRNGYKYSATPFVPVRQSTINTFMAAPPPPTPPPQQQQQPAPAGVVAHGIPVGRISAVQRFADGWWGLNASGKPVLKMPLDVARNIVQDHAHIQVMGLS